MAFWPTETINNAVFVLNGQEKASENGKCWYKGTGQEYLAKESLRSFCGSGRDKPKIK